MHTHTHTQTMNSPERNTERARDETRFILCAVQSVILCIRHARTERKIEEKEAKQGRMKKR